MFTVADIRQQFIEMHQAFPDGNAPGGMLEIVGASFLADEDAIFGRPNADYIRREIEWYSTQSTTIRTMDPPIPTIWQDIAGRDGYVNSNYGYLFFNDGNHNQFMNVVAALLRDPATRQAIAIYTNPKMHAQSQYEGCQDFVCTNAVQYLIRNRKLDAVVQMRSNDVVFGYRNDYAWQRYAQGYVACVLDVPIGNIIWQVGSLHVYPRHRYLIKEVD